MTWGTARPGDWVRARTALDGRPHLWGGPSRVPRGARGVVVDRHGRHLTVEFDVGWSTTVARVRPGDVRVVRPAGGAAAFRHRTSRLTVVRLGMAFALCLPVLHFTAAYVWSNRGTEGLGAALAMGVLYGIEDSVVAALNQPGKALVYLAVVALLSRFGFGRHRV